MSKITTGKGWIQVEDSDGKMVYIGFFPDVGLVIETGETNDMYDRQQVWFDNSQDDSHIVVASLSEFFASFDYVKGQRGSLHYYPQHPSYSPEYEREEQPHFTDDSQ